MRYKVYLFYIIIKPDGNVADLDAPKPGSYQLNKIIDNYLTGDFITN